MIGLRGIGLRSWTGRTGRGIFSWTLAPVPPDLNAPHRESTSNGLSTSSSLKRGGMRFQGLAVVLGKQRWPELLAHQRKKDLGLDAYAPASETPEGIGKGLAASITPSWKQDRCRREGCQGELS